MATVTNTIAAAVAAVADPAAAAGTPSLAVRDLFNTCPRALPASTQISVLHELHLRAAAEVCNQGEDLAEFTTIFLRDLQNIVNVLDCIGLTSDQAPAKGILSFGEVWSRQLFSYALQALLRQENVADEVLVCQLDAANCILAYNENGYRRTDNLKAADLHRERRTPASVSMQCCSDLITECFVPGLKRSDVKTRVESAAISPSEAFKPSTQRSAMQLKHLTSGSDVYYTLQSEQGGGTGASSPLLSRENQVQYWPLPPVTAVDSSYWPVLPPGSAPSTYPGIKFEASYERLRSEYTKHVLPRLCAQSTMVWLAQGYACRLDFAEALGNLGRNGSDTSAVVFGVLLGAEGCTIWSDVEGIYSADPRRCPNAVLLSTVSYDEALELASFGAKVLHPACLIPASHTKMPILLKSTVNPGRSGTLITDIETGHFGEFGKTVSCVGGVTLLTIQNESNVPHFMSRLFMAVEEGEAKPLQISQSSTTSAITVGVDTDQEERVLGQLMRVFKYDVSKGAKINLTIDRGCSLLCITGRGQSGYPGALAAWCESLAAERVSIKSVSQSSNELSTCFAVRSAEAEAALQSLHNKVLERLAPPHTAPALEA